MELLHSSKLNWIGYLLTYHKVLIGIAKKAARGIFNARFETFGCVVQSSTIKPLSLEGIVRCYA